MKEDTCNFLKIGYKKMLFYDRIDVSEGIC